MGDLEGAVAGVILAGGTAQRFNKRDKALVELRGRPLISWVIDQVAPQVDLLCINANRGAERFERFGIPIISDDWEKAGPLAGVMAGLDWADSKNMEYLAIFPCDMPFLPEDQVAMLLRGIGDGQAACLKGSDRRQSLCALLHVSLRGALRRSLEAGVRKVDVWLESQRVVDIEIHATVCERLSNINTPDDLKQAEAWLVRTS